MDKNDLNKTYLDKEESMNPDKNQCGLCHFWVPESDEDGHELGLCRRWPPAYEGWPMTDIADWCGEFSPARNPAATPGGQG